MRTSSTWVASSQGYGRRPEYHSSHGGRNLPKSAATSSWPSTRATNMASSTQSVAAIAGEGRFGGVAALRMRQPLPPEAGSLKGWMIRYSEHATCGEHERRITDVPLQQPRPECALLRDTRVAR